jgi:hypothetical protein
MFNVTPAGLSIVVKICAEVVDVLEGIHTPTIAEHFGLRPLPFKRKLTKIRVGDADKFSGLARGKLPECLLSYRREHLLPLDVQLLGKLVCMRADDFEADLAAWSLTLLLRNVVMFQLWDSHFISPNYGFSLRERFLP